MLHESPEFAEDNRLLRTIPGIGPCTIAELRAVADPADFDSAKGMAAFFGLNPAKRQSGTSLDRTRISKAGHKWVRRALFLAALSASVHNPVARAFAERLRERRSELARKQVILACAHKLVHTIYGVLKTQTPFDAGKAGLIHVA